MSEKSIDDHWTDWEASAFGYGYGTGEAYTIPALKTWFAAVGRPHAAHAYDFEVLQQVCGHTVAWLLINALCRADVIEYGTSPRFGWLTEEGMAIKEYVDGKSTKDLLELTARDKEYINCYPNACNCGPNGYDENRKCPNPFWPYRS